MTVVIGLKHSGKVWVAADSRITDEDGVKYDLDISLDSKLLRLKKSIIGFAGDLMAKSFMENYVTAKRKREFEFTDRQSVIRFFMGFREFLKTKIEESEISKMEVSWLIATKERLYICDSDLSVVEARSFCAIGTGGTSARAALEYMQLYNPELEPEEKLKRAYEIAIKHNANCGGDQEVYKIDDLLKSGDPT